MQGGQDTTGQFCRHCGRQIESDSSFCRFCGRPTTAVASPPPPGVPPLDKPATSHRRRRLLVFGLIFALIAVAAVILAIIYVPVSHSFSASIYVPSGRAGNQNLTFPKGAPVSGTWDTSNGAAVAWCSILTQAGGIVYNTGSAVSGSFSFTATYSTYEFECGGGPTALTVDVSGTYSTPLSL